MSEESANNSSQKELEDLQLYDRCLGLTTEVHIWHLFNTGDYTMSEEYLLLFTQVDNCI